MADPQTIEEFYFCHNFRNYKKKFMTSKKHLSWRKEPNLCLLNRKKRNQLCNIFTDQEKLVDCEFEKLKTLTIEDEWIWFQSIEGLDDIFYKEKILELITIE